MENQVGDKLKKSLFVRKLTLMDRKVEFYAYNRTTYKVVTNIKVNLNVRAILERKWKNLVTE